MRKLGYIQEFLGEKILQHKEKKHVRSAIAQNIETAKTVGILFFAKDQKEHKKVVDYVDILIKKHKMQVQSLGFVQNQELLSAFHGQNGFKYFSKKDFNWYGKPSHVNIDDFINEPFDIFLDLTIENSYPFQYISTFSKASFTVGRFIEQKMPYDFMIDIKKEHSVDYLIKQIHIYLSMIQVSK